MSRSSNIYQCRLPSATIKPTRRNLFSTSEVFFGSQKEHILYVQSACASLPSVVNAHRLAIPGLPLNCQTMASGLCTSLRPYTPPSISPEIVTKDKFHPVIRGERTLEISPELQQRMEAVRSHISQTEQKENIIMPGAEVGIVTLGTGGSLPSKYRNGL